MDKKTSELTMPTGAEELIAVNNPIEPNPVVENPAGPAAAGQVSNLSFRPSKFPAPLQNLLPKPIANVAFKHGVDAASEQSRSGARSKRPSRKFGGNSMKCRFSSVGRATDL